MFSYIIRRTFYAIPILLGVIIITFFLFYIVHPPHSMALQMLGPKAKEEAIQNWLHNRGYDRAMFVDLSGTKIGKGYTWGVNLLSTVPRLYFRLTKHTLPSTGLREKLMNYAFPLTPAGKGSNMFDTQFFHHILSLARFDLGKSLKTGEPIITMFKRGALPSLLITVPAFFVGITTSIMAALFLVFVRESVLDLTGTVVCVISMSIPIMAYVIFGQMLFATQWKFFPAFGFIPGGFSMLRFVALPICIMAFAGLGASIRMYRAIFLEEARNDYVRTAYAKGLSARRVFLVHILKNGMISLITLVVAELPMLIMGSLVIEDFFGIPGLGNMAINAIHSADFTVIMAEVFVGSLLFLFGLLLTDICYAIADPRIRLG